MALNRESVIRAAEKYVARGKLEAGIKEYRKVLAENPNDANTLNRVGDLYARTERFGEAVKLFTQIAEQYTRDGFFVKAIAIYKKIIKLDPSSLTVYESLAELYYKQGLLNEARTQYQVLADYYQKHDNAASAISIFHRMSEIEPENPAFHLKLAELYESQRLTDKALASYRQLADLLIVNGSIEEAAQVFLRALDIGSEDLEFIRSTVVGLHGGGHVGAAARVLARAVESNPEAAAIAEEIDLAGARPPEFRAAAEAEGAPAADAETGEAVADALEPPAPEPGVAASPALEDTDATSVAPVETSSAASETEGGEAADVASFASFDGAADAGTDEELEVFTLDLEDDEIPDTLVAPPPDMLEPATAPGPEAAAAADEPPPGSETGDDALAAAAASEGVAEEAASADVASQDGPSIEIDLSELDLDEVEAAAASSEVEKKAAEAAPAAGFELSIDLDDLEDEAPSAIGLAEAAAAEPEALEVEDEGRETAPADLEPEELEQVVEELAEIELEVDAPAPTDLEPEALEPVAGEPAAPPIIRREEDLLAEARVFAKYGLEEKALDRLGELLELQPEHVEGLELKTRIFFEGGRHQEALTVANEVARVAQETGNLGPWRELRADLVEAGYAIEDEQVLDEPLEKPAVDDDRIAQLLEDLSLEDFDATALAPLDEPLPTPEDETAPESAPPGAPQSVVVEPEAAGPEAPAAGPEAPAAGPEAAPVAAGPEPEKKLVSLVEELGLDELQDEPGDFVAVAGAPQKPAPAETPAAAAETAAKAGEAGMSWLDDVAGVDEAGDRDEALFEEEDDFFDLAAELERELDEDDLAEGVVVQPQEQSLEEIIEGFKQGVAEHLSAEDYETHFNLGIAYREMGLLDEAIGEFQLASKDQRYLVDCSSLLGICFLEKGLPELAVRWYRRGLEVPTISDQATLGLLYDMGNAYLSLGDSDAASKTFVEVYGLNSNYRDVSAKLEELGAVP